MKTTHVALLNEQASHYFEQAILSTKSREKLSYTETARAMLKEAREIIQSSRRNSIMVYFEFMLLLKKQPEYKSYLEFCARNDLDLLSESDYISLTSSINKELIPR